MLLRLWKLDVTKIHLGRSWSVVKPPPDMWEICTSIYCASPKVICTVHAFSVMVYELITRKKNSKNVRTSLKVVLLHNWCIVLFLVMKKISSHLFTYHFCFKAVKILHIEFKAYIRNIGTGMMLCRGSVRGIRQWLVDSPCKWSVMRRIWYFLCCWSEWTA